MIGLGLGLGLTIRGAGAREPKTPPDPALITPYRYVMPRGRIASPLIAGGGTADTFEGRLYTQTFSIAPTAVAILVAAKYVINQQGEFNAPNAFTASFALERITGAQNAPFKWSGVVARSWTPGDIVKSDDLTGADITLTASAAMPVRSSIVLPSSAATAITSFNGSRSNAGTQDAEVKSLAGPLQYSGTGDYSKIAPYSTTTGALTPLAIVGLWPSGQGLISVFLRGDSLMSGTGDAADTYSQGGGFGERGCKSAAVPYCKYGVASDTTASQIADCAAELEAVRYATDVIDELAGNDIAQGVPAATIYARKLVQWGLYRARGVKRITVVLPPTRTNAGNTAPLDGYEEGGIKDQYIALVLAGLGVGDGADYAINPNAATCDAVDPRLWNPLYLTDGIHTNAAGYTAWGAVVATHLTTTIGINNF